MASRAKVKPARTPAARGGQVDPEVGKGSQIETSITETTETTATTETTSSGPVPLRPSAIPGALLEVAGSKPGLKSTELWLTVTAAAAIAEIALAGTPTWPDAACCLALAVVVGAYSISRAVTKGPVT